MSMKDSLVQSDCLGETLGQRLGGMARPKHFETPPKLLQKSKLAKRFPILLRMSVKAILAYFLDLVTL